MLFLATFYFLFQRLNSGKKSANDDQLVKISKHSSNNKHKRKEKRDHETEPQEFARDNESKITPGSPETGTKSTQTQTQSMKILNLQRKVAVQVTDCSG